MSNNALVLIALAGTLTGCAQPKKATTGSQSDSAAGSLGPIDSRVRALITSPLRGASSIDPSAAHIVINVSCPHGGFCSDDKSATAVLLATKVQVTDGTTTTAVIPDPLPASPGASPGKTDQPVTLPQNEYTLGFHTGSALRADAQYALRVTSDATTVAGFIDSTPQESGAALAGDKTAVVQESRFFTGSIPYAVSTEISNDPAKQLMSIRIRFSEPLQLSSVASNIQIVNAAGNVVGSCPWSALSRQCADASTKEVSQTIDFSFTAAVTKADLMGARLVLRGSLMGSGRTLAQALSAVGKPLAANGSANIGLPAILWTPCSTSGDVLCIRDVGTW